MSAVFTSPTDGTRSSTFKFLELLDLRITFTIKVHKSLSNPSLSFEEKSVLWVYLWITLIQHKKKIICCLTMLLVCLPALLTVGLMQCDCGWRALL